MEEDEEEYNEMEEEEKRRGGRRETQSINNFMISYKQQLEQETNKSTHISKYIETDLMNLDSLLHPASS